MSLHRDSASGRAAKRAARPSAPRRRLPSPSVRPRTLLAGAARPRPAGRPAGVPRSQAACRGGGRRRPWSRAGSGSCRLGRGPRSRRTGRDAAPSRRSQGRTWPGPRPPARRRGLGDSLARRTRSRRRRDRGQDRPGRRSFRLAGLQEGDAAVFADDADEADHLGGRRGRGGMNVSELHALNVNAKRTSESSQRRWRRNGPRTWFGTISGLSSRTYPELPVLFGFSTEGARAAEGVQPHAL